MNEIETTKRNTFRDLAVYWLPLLAWMGMIFCFSAQPRLPRLPEPSLDALLKKGAHFGVYGLLAFWWWRALSRGRKTERITIGLAFVFTVLYAMSDEFHQSFVPGRRPSLKDVLIDAGGAAVAIGLIWWRRGR